MAYHERALGRRALIPVPYDGVTNNQVTLQPFATTVLMNEAEALFERIDLELKRMGIYLDEPDSPDKTATEVLSNIEKSNEFVRQIMEFNADEVEFELKVVLNMCKKFIKKSDKTPLDLTTIIEFDGKPVRADFLTLGTFRKALDDRNWFFRVNSRSGTIPSGVMQRAQLSSVLPLLPQGSKAQMEGIKSLASLSDVDFVTDQSLAPPPQQGLTPPNVKADNAIAQPPEEVARDEVRFRELSPT